MECGEPTGICRGRYGTPSGRCPGRSLSLSLYRRPTMGCVPTKGLCSRPPDPIPSLVFLHQRKAAKPGHWMEPGLAAMPNPPKPSVANHAVTNLSQHKQLVES